MSDKSYQFVLCGNPNSGKTSLFNALTGSSQRVGNWPGVTVEKKEGTIRGQDDLTLVDLPGVYSLSPYTLEERIARDYLETGNFDLIINIVDSSMLERSLFLTLQIRELGRPMLLALNMQDLLEKRGIRLDAEKLSDCLGIPVAEISAVKETGLDQLIEMAKATAGRARVPEGKLSAVKSPEERYRQIEGILAGTLSEERKDQEEDLDLTGRIDRVVTHPLLALPIFALIIFLVYYISVTLTGRVLSGFMENTLIQGWIQPTIRGWMENVSAAPWLIGIVCDGIIRGVGTVLSFLPQLAILFLFLSLLEQSGYMARVAFILDRSFRRFGLPGKAFIPILVGTGCSVPAIMACRTIEKEEDRRLTDTICSFMPCGAKLPLIALIAGALFNDSGWVGPSAFFLGIFAILFSSLVLKKSSGFSGDPTPFVMELPEYRFPSLKGMYFSVLERVRSFVRKAGTLILLCSIILWFFKSYGIVDGQFRYLAELGAEYSLLAAIGRCFAWIFAPLGFGNWQSAVASLSGIMAKENIVNSFGVLFQMPETAAAAGAASNLQALEAFFTPLSAYSFLCFNLLCSPCLAALSVLRQELGSWKWLFFAIGFQSAIAYSFSLIIYQTGLLLGGHAFTYSSAAALAVLGVWLFLLLRPAAPEKEENLSA